MKETPILFSGEMIRAERDGRKTMTRRTSGLEGINENNTPDEWVYLGKSSENAFEFQNIATKWSVVARCKQGQVGDRLWVKEAHYAFGHWEHIGATKTGKKKWAFVYDGKQVVFDAPKDWCFSRCKGDPVTPRWYKRNSLFMPRWASRTTLEITSVEAERLKDITEGEAKREGVKGALVSEDGVHSAYRIDFAVLWNSINGNGSWDANKWVFAIGFKRVEATK